MLHCFGPIAYCVQRILDSVAAPAELGRGGPAAAAAVRHQSTGLRRARVRVSQIQQRPGHRRTDRLGEQVIRMDRVPIWLFEWTIPAII